MKRLPINSKNEMDSSSDHPANDSSKFPESYRVASANRFDNQEIDDFIAGHRPSFFYGSLMFPCVVMFVIRQENVIGVAKQMTPATIHGHHRYAVEGADFPAVLPSEDPYDTVNGFLGFGFTQDQRLCLDLFEGGMYDRHVAKATIELKDGTTREVEADVYIWNQRDERLEEPSVREWSPEFFLETSFYQSFARDVEPYFGEP